ncbi:MAG: mechanosensitive ion channel [Acidimicrobiaceae bacterium]|nr:mechanosensitive ion channel [Acidimicrobiaceae bacterium]MYJ42071.1 mechanosensitive ion channel [Acidimicrobiaceae bacterium]MYJ81911.1 mechanosensitive ion channel [Acidimicrobiaceae bacterium]
MTLFVGVLAQADGEALLHDELTSGDWIKAGIVLVATVVLAISLSKILRRTVSRGIGHGFAAILISRFLGYAVFIVGLSYALTVLGVRVGPLLGALGLGGLVLALALQGVVGNFVSSLILQARRPYTVGDTVELDGRLGVVEDIDSRTTQIRGLDGTHIRIPNANVAAATIVNLTRETVRRSSLAVGVAYDTDLQQATDAIYEALDRVPRVLSEPEPAVNLDGFGGSSIGFNVLYWHASDVPSELATRHDLVLAIHQAFAATSITIAFPQVTVWSGEQRPDRLYGGEASEVRTPYPGLDVMQAERGRRSLAWRRGGRRRSEAEPTDDQ